MSLCGLLSLNFIIIGFSGEFLYHIEMLFQAAFYAAKSMYLGRTLKCYYVLIVLAKCRK